MSIDPEQGPSKGTQIAALYQQAKGLADSLDKQELHQAAAYVSMAMDAMRREFSELGQLD